MLYIADFIILCVLFILSNVFIPDCIYFLVCILYHLVANKIEFMYPATQIHIIVFPKACRIDMEANNYIHVKLTVKPKNEPNNYIPFCYQKRASQHSTFILNLKCYFQGHRMNNFSLKIIILFF